MGKKEFSFRGVGDILRIKKLFYVKSAYSNLVDLGLKFIRTSLNLTNLRLFIQRLQTLLFANLSDLAYN